MSFIADKSAVVSKSHVRKKSEKPKRSKSGASGGTVGAGYEMIGQRQKVTKRDDGGYVIPSKANAPAGTAGSYELAGPSSPMVLDDHSIMPPHKTKKSHKWLIIVAVLIVVATCMTGVFLYFIYVISSKKEPLPSISDQCRKSQTPSIHQHCVYHKRKYPDNCNSTRCDTLLLKWDEKNKKFMIDDSKVVSINAVMDRTPCQDGKWCINGSCVETANKLVNEYSTLKPVNGKLKNHCNEPSCIDSEKRFRYFSTGCRPPKCKDKDARRFRIGFRSCTYPYPSYGGEFCDHQANITNIYGAMYVTKDCGLCSGPSTIPEECPLLPQTCKLQAEDECPSDIVLMLDDFRSGYECHSNDPERHDICFSGMCLPNDPLNYKCD